jgi:hypothetical protein
MSPSNDECEMDVFGNYKCDCSICGIDESTDDDEKSTKYRIMSLKALNEKLRKAVTCVVCNVKQVETLLLPCTHVNMCDPCADEAKECPLCKERILGTVRIYVV